MIYSYILVKPKGGRGGTTTPFQRAPLPSRPPQAGSSPTVLVSQYYEQIIYIFYTDYFFHYQEQFNI